MSVASTRLLQRGVQLVSVVRLKPFDTSTEEGRSQERFRRAALTSLASIAAKAVSMLSLIISVPLTLHYLGTERYSLWLTISSVIAMLSFADLGMGNGLLNVISAAHGKNDRAGAQRYVSSAFFMLAALGLTIGAGFALAYPWISWARLFNIHSPQAIREAGPAVIVLFASFALAIPLGIVQRVQTAYQEGFQSNLWQLVNSLLGLAMLVLAIRLRAGLPWLVLAVEGTTITVLAANFLVFFGLYRRWLWPRAGHWVRSAAQQILRTGLLFFILQMAYVVTYTSDNLVAAHIIGPAAVVQYSLAVRLFNVVTLLVGMLLSPLWPAYGEALARGDILWVKRTLVRSVTLTAALTFLPCSALIVIGNHVVHRWVGHSVVLPLMLMAGIAVWAVLGGMGNAVSVFLNGANVVRFQVASAVTCAILTLATKICFARWFGVSGIAWATVVCGTLFITIPYAIYVPMLLKRTYAAAETTETNGLMKTETPVASPTEVPAVVKVPGGAGLHLTYLDSIRAIAALLVVLSHEWLQVWPVVTDPTAIQSAPMSSGLFFIHAGHFSVDMFIVLSGYCLMLPVVRAGGILKDGAKGFYLRRARRILPTYYAGLGLSLVFIFTLIGKTTGTHWDASLPVTKKGIIAHLLLVHDLFSPYQINHAYWSVAVETWIYLLFPVLLLGWRRFGIAKTMGLIFLAAYSVFFVVHGKRFATLTPDYLFLFALGMFSAQLCFGNDDKQKVSRLPWIGVSIGIAAAVYMTMYIIGAARTNINLPVLDLLMGIAASAFLTGLYFSEAGTIRRILSWSPLVFIGTFAYSIYLVHAPLIQVFWQYVLHPLHLSPGMTFAALIVCGLPVFIFISYVFFYFFERPFITKNVKVARQKLFALR